MLVQASALVRSCYEPVPGRAGVQGRADTLQVRPCKLAVFIPENRRSAQPCPPAHQLVGWGAGLCRPSVFRDENRELTGTYLQRVGTALHPSTTWHGLVAGTYQRRGLHKHASINNTAISHSASRQSKTISAGNAPRG